MSEAPIAGSSLGRGGSLSAAQMQEFNDVREFYKIYYNKYVTYKILHEAVEDASDAACLEPDLKLKVQDVILGSGCSQVLELDSEAGGSLLGLTRLTSAALSYDESSKLKRAVVAALESKHERIRGDFLKTFGEDVTTVPSCSEFGDLSLSAADRALCELRSQLEGQRRRYLDGLLEERKLLEMMVDLRLEELPKACENKVTECRFKAQMSALRSRLVRENARIDVFEGTSNSLSAYTELVRDLREQREECQLEIQHLEQLKEKYAQVACKQYSDMLKSYAQYKASLAKKKIIYESLYS